METGLRGVCRDFLHRGLVFPKIVRCVSCREEIGRRKKAVESHYREFHGHLMELLDFSWIKERVRDP